jgi:hypothetical protein
VRGVLQTLRDEPQLAQSPLIDARLVWLRAGDCAGVAERARALRDLVTDAIARLRDTARGARAHRVLVATYLESCPGQKVTADQLGLSFGTYRRHLVEGIELVADELWRHETS